MGGWITLGGQPVSRQANGDPPPLRCDLTVQTFTGLRRHIGAKQPFAQPQAHDDLLIQTVRARQTFTLAGGVTGLFDRLQPDFRRPVLPGGDLAAGVAVVARHGQASVGAGAEPHIVAVAPVGHVVAAFLPRPGVVGHFIGWLLGHLIQRRRLRLGQLGQVAAPTSTMENGVFLNRQLIERKVIGAQFQRRHQLPRPGIGRLFGPGVNQIKGKARHGPPGQVNRRQGFGQRMLAPQEPQVLVVQGLHPDGKPVDPGPREAGELLRLRRGRIGLQADFQIFGQAPVRAQALQQRRHGFRRHQRGRSAAKKHRGQAAAFG